MKALRPTQEFKTLYLIMGILIILLGFAMTFTGFKQRDRLIQNGHEHAEQEIELIGLFVQDALVKNDYAAVDQFIRQWGLQHEKIMDLKVSSGNSSVLAHYISNEPAQFPDHVTLELDIPNSTNVNLEMVYDIVSVKEYFSQTILLNIVALIIFTVAVGTTFRVYLPAVLKRISAVSAPGASHPEGQGRILLMDDEIFVRDAVGEMLTSIGHSVVFAEDGAAAIQLYEDASKAGKSFDAVIMDLTIQGGMGGRETVKELLDFDPHARVIVASGYSNDDVMSSYSSYGFKGVLLKPFDIDTLSNVLQVVLTDDKQVE